VTRLGCRAEYLSADRPRTHEAHAASNVALERHILYALNRGVLLAPFHRR
jgi:hypothetical protein